MGCGWQGAGARFVGCWGAVQGAEQTVLVHGNSLSSSLATVLLFAVCTAGRAATLLRTLTHALLRPWQAIGRSPATLGVWEIRLIGPPRLVEVVLGQICRRLLPSVESHPCPAASKRPQPIVVMNSPATPNDTRASHSSRLPARVSPPFVFFVPRSQREKHARPSPLTHRIHAAHARVILDARTPVRIGIGEPQKFQNTLMPEAAVVSATVKEWNEFVERKRAF
ncbi:hypothetical protein STAS_22669 [Striga asiatica]|uniref:Uncharacterized protein n=1 Tax=Striga asiatica TaxID=4170 RepID=A0A5A7QLG0_STRAF|nr:hypothetical protein STAS_22669 [Striga asiatica]